MGDLKAKMREHQFSTSTGCLLPFHCLCPLPQPLCSLSIASHCQPGLDLSPLVTGSCPLVTAPRPQEPSGFPQPTGQCSALSEQQLGHCAEPAPESHRLPPDTAREPQPGLSESPCQELPMCHQHTLLGTKPMAPGSRSHLFHCPEQGCHPEPTQMPLCLLTPHPQPPRLLLSHSSGHPRPCRDS